MDDELLKLELVTLNDLDFDLELTGFSEEEIKGLMAPPGNSDQQNNSTMFEQFLVPPFSVLDARQGYWQERKSAWLDLGIQSELGRGGVVDGGGASNNKELKLLQRQKTQPWGVAPASV